MRDDQGEQSAKVTYRRGMIGKDVIDPQDGKTKPIHELQAEDWIERVIADWEFVRGDEDNPIPIPPTRKGIEESRELDEGIEAIWLSAVVGEVYRDAQPGKLIKKESDDT
jgi:hypothetical protein